MSRLLGLFFFGAFLCVCFCPRASANTPEGAWKACVAASSWVNANEPSAYGGPTSCLFHTSPEVGQPGYYLNSPRYPLFGCSGVYGEIPTHSDCFTSVPYDAQSICDSSPPYSGAFSGKLSAGAQMCSPQPGGIGCMMTFAPDSPSFQLSDGKSWGSHGTYSPNGSLCTPSGSPTDPESPPEAVPPVSCRGGSCYDSTNKQFCAVDASGHQFCVSASPDPGTGKPKPACISSGDNTICSGSPPPLPPPPPASPISDPPSEIHSSDNFPMSNGGGNFNMTVNNYGTGNTPSSSGQKPGDDGPASSSSSPTPGDGTDKDKGSASGGQDCNTPPVCQGDAPTCMVVSQAWLGRCKPDWYDKNGDGIPDWIGDGRDLPGVGVPDQVDPTSVVSTDTASIGSIDESGWAGVTCPQLPDLQLFGKSITYGDQAMFCDWLAKLRAVFLLVGAFVAARILASGGKS